MSSEKNVNNSVSISGGNVSGNQFATNSDTFTGSITNNNNIRIEFEQLTSSLKQALNSEAKSIQEVDVSDITDAIEQVKEETLKKSPNKLSLKGILSGIEMVMGTLKDISSSTKQLFTDWKGVLGSLMEAL